MQAYRQVAQIKINEQSFAIKVVTWLLALTFSAGILAFIAPNQILPILPAVIAANVTVGALLILRGRQRHAPIDDIGAWYICIVCLYAVIPLIGYALSGYKFDRYSDTRLFQFKPEPEEIAYVGWYYVAHLLSFATVYCMARRKVAVEPVAYQSPSTSGVATIIILLVLIKLPFLVLSMFFDVSYDSYAESYAIYSRMPLVVAQVASRISGMQVIVNILVLAWMFTDYRKYRSIIWGWLVITLLLAIAQVGTSSRFEMFMLIGSTAILYHLKVRPLNSYIIIGIGSAGLVFFYLLGVMRGQAADPKNGISLITPDVPIFAKGNEFQGLFANAYDFHQRVADDRLDEPPPGLLFSEVFALVPQQLLPVDKLDPSWWYVRTYYPLHAKMGGGFAFGVIPRSLLGFGWLELIARGMILGLICARLHFLYNEFC